MNKTLLALLLFAVCLALLLIFHTKPKSSQGELIVEAMSKAETATKIAVEAESKAVDTEIKAVKARPAVQTAKEAVKMATEERIAAMIHMKSLPMPIQREINELVEFVATLETQVWLEVMRGDMWKESSEAWQEAAEANKELADVIQSESEAIKKAAWWKGLKLGTASGILGILLMLVLL